MQFDGTLKITPRSPDSEGKAWMYDVIFSPDKPGQTSAIFNVDLTYSSRNYSRATENLILESRVIPHAAAQPYSNVPYQPEPNIPPPSTNTSKTKIPLLSSLTAFAINRSCPTFGASFPWVRMVNKDSFLPYLSK